MKPCPFCGRHDPAILRDTGDCIDAGYVAVCSCTAQGPVGRTPEDAVIEWDTRTEPAPAGQ